MGQTDGIRKAHPAPMTHGIRIWYYKVDPELKIIHLFGNCAGLKVAQMYNYTEEFKLKDEVDALRLDFLVEKKGYTPCHVCWKREVPLARKEQRRCRPGFVREPRKK